VRDALEKELFAGGLLAVEDVEAGVSFLVDADDQRSKRAFADAVAAERVRLKKMFASTGVGHIDIQDRERYIDDLVAYFNARHARHH